VTLTCSGIADLLVPVLVLVCIVANVAVMVAASRVVALMRRFQRAIEKGAEPRDFRP
jgi:hypothetical protein